MIYLAKITAGKRTAQKWIVGNSDRFSLTRWQKFSTDQELRRRINCQDDFLCTEFFQRQPSGRLEFICAGNCY